MSAKQVVGWAAGLLLIVGLSQATSAAEPLRDWKPDLAQIDATVADALADRVSQTAHLRYGWGYWPGYYGYGYGYGGLYSPYFGGGYYGSYYAGYPSLYNAYYGGGFYNPPLSYSYYYPTYAPAYYGYTAYRPIFAAPRRCCGFGGCYYW